MADIFISYSSKDKVQANVLVGLLHTIGYSVWIDQSGIDGAASWSKEIAKAVSDSSLFLILLSEHALASSNVAKELSVAAELQKHILPIALEKVQLRNEFLYHLSGLQRVHHDDIEAITNALEKLRISGTNVPPSELPERTEALSMDAIKHVAVLPFEDQSPLKDNEWFADGMMDELINTLSRLEKLKVNPRGDVIYYKKSRPKLSEIAADLKCRYIVEGRVQKAGEKIRISISLSDALEHKQIWSEKYDGRFDDIFDLQDKTCFAIAQGLKVKLTQEEEQTIEKKPTEDPEAYELYLKAGEYHRRRTRIDYERALELNREAVRLDPDFAAAHLEIATASLDFYRYYSRDDSAIDEAEKHIIFAEELYGESADVYRLRSHVARMRNQLEEALRLAEAAVKRAPDYAPAYDALGWAYLALGNKEETVRARRKCVELKENDLNTHFNYLIALHELGDKTRLTEASTAALPIYERHVRFSPDDLTTRCQYANILRWSGDLKRASHEVHSLEAEDGLDGRALYVLTCFHLNEGQNEEGLRTLRRSIAKGFRPLETFRRDPDLDPIRGTTEFKELMKSLAEPGF